GDELLRPGEAYSSRAQRESEANAFTAALLLPPAALRRNYLAVRRASHGSRRSTIRALAERFGVSEDVVLRQLAALLLPGADDVEEAVAHGGSVTQRWPAASGSARLDEWQRRAAESGTPALIVAGPGTGKTSTLVGRVAHLVRERGVAPSA